MLEITASSTCPAGGQGTLFDRDFRFQMLRSEDGREFVLQLPSGPAYSGPNSGSLTLKLGGELGKVTGTLAGNGLAADGVHSVVISAKYPPEGQATVRGDGALGAGTVVGTLSGNISMSIYRSSAGGECTAADHSWRLTPN